MTAQRFYTTEELMNRLANTQAAAKEAIRLAAYRDRRNSRRRERYALAKQMRAAPVKADAVPEPGRRDILHLASVRPRDTFGSVIGRVCQTLGITKASMRARHRAVRITTTRQVLGWVGVKRMYRSYPDAGRTLNRDHTSILHAAQKIDRLITERGLVVPSDPLAAALYLNRELGGVQ